MDVRPSAPASTSGALDQRHHRRPRRGGGHRGCLDGLTRAGPRRRRGAERLHRRTAARARDRGVRVRRGGGPGQGPGARRRRDAVAGGFPGPTWTPTSSSPPAGWPPWSPSPHGSGRRLSPWCPPAVLDVERAALARARLLRRQRPAPGLPPGTVRPGADRASRRPAAPVHRLPRWSSPTTCSSTPSSGCREGRRYRGRVVVDDPAPHAGSPSPARTGSPGERGDAPRGGERRAEATIRPGPVGLVDGCGGPDPRLWPAGAVYAAA